jgi:hypothetical protein
VTLLDVRLPLVELLGRLPLMAAQLGDQRDQNDEGPEHSGGSTAFRLGEPNKLRFSDF